MNPVFDPQPDFATRRRHTLLYAAACGTMGLAGCATVGTAPSSAPPPVVQPAPAGPLAIERRWLQQWFDGTPVRIAQGDDGALTVEVPLAFSFDGGRSALKPALAAVLDKVAESLRRVQRARLLRVAAPQDRNGTSALALQRAGAVRRHLMMRGVGGSRIASPSVAEPAAVQLRLDLPAG